MGKNRDSLSIVADILEGTGSGASKTRIMFAANLSFKLLEKYLDLVLQAGLITVESRKYQLTEQGQRFFETIPPFQGSLYGCAKPLSMFGQRTPKTFFCLC